MNVIQHTIHIFLLYNLLRQICQIPNAFGIFENKLQNGINSFAIALQQITSKGSRIGVVCAATRSILDFLECLEKVSVGVSRIGIFYGVLNRCNVKKDCTLKQFFFVYILQPLWQK